MNTYVVKKRGPYRNAPKPGELRGTYTTHICKTCGNEFRRRPWSKSSREYCTYRCEPKRREKQVVATPIKKQAILVDTILTCDTLQAKVIQPFAINVYENNMGESYVSTVDVEGFVTYEIAYTIEDAIQGLLCLIPDELAWLERHEQHLGIGPLEDLRVIQRYIQLVSDSRTDKEG